MNHICEKKIRTPRYKAWLYPDGHPRVGHHNDCFLKDDTDAGTYVDADAERGTVAAEAAAVFIGGETCGVHPRATCANALPELALLRFDYLNAAYHGAVLDGWEADGCAREITERLGYRLVLEEVKGGEAELHR